MLIIGVTGKAHSGKDTVGRYIQESCFSFGHYAFSSPLKEVVRVMFQLTKEQQLDENKEKIIEFWGTSPRRMYQLMGTECGRKMFGEDIWIRRAELAYDELRRSGTLSGIVITDVRFNNEANWVKEKNGIIIKLERDFRIVESEHSSELGVDAKFIDYSIQNNGTIQQLLKEVDACIQKIFS